MPYTRVFLTNASTDDPGIRTALGFDASDTTTMPQALIEQPPFLPVVERRTKDAVPTWAAIVAAAGDPLEDLKLAVMYGTAALFASTYFARREREEMKSAGLGDQSVSWRDAASWMDIAKNLAKQSAQLLADLNQDDDGSYLPELVTVAGPTRARVDARTKYSQIDWERFLVPLPVSGQEF